MIKAAGGRFLAIGAGPKVTTFEGDPPKRFVLQVWDSMGIKSVYEQPGLSGAAENWRPIC